MYGARGVILTEFVFGLFVMVVFLNIIFQIIHLRDYRHLTSPDEGQPLHNEFPRYVLENTLSFSIDGSWMNWFTGGLNNHTIHHIFPRICQIHFSALTQILKNTAHGYSVPFKEYPSLWAAARSHFKMLYKLSKPDPYKPEPFLNYPLSDRFVTF